MRKTKRHRWLFVAFVGFLSLQAGAASLWREPYPAFIYPHFARSKGEVGQIDVLTPEFMVEFDDGGQAEARVEQVFREIPTNLSNAMAKEMLLDPRKRQQGLVRRLKPGLRQSLVALRGRLRSDRTSLDPSSMDPELQRWLGDNLRQAFEGREPTRFVANWWLHKYSRSVPPQKLGRDLVDSFACNL